ncbi:hypothetical protein KCV87_02135 [Actinosynnema pretiosum subsp. pretiosum]|uniref:Uncharacterized protein n=1 Tax=Actinosynnema pretiosum subsp. pretiosum TaxID=103721 RepID=A0AA45R4N2_9PSEU|nr:hypothetical protein APASM_3586 [Actinosynnema pretiosum subsp. pretiosum]QUF04954.1 hypothetical protein KCV87_02135 [Actinosynnema pretiosum subsp. pretiosum]
MVFGSRDGFGLEFHVERDPDLLCVDVFVAGLHVDAWDNAFYPPLLVKKLGDEIRRFREPAARPEGFTSALEAFRLAESSMTGEGEGGETETGERFAGFRFLDWGECTDLALAFAFPDGDLLHLACRVRDDDGPGTPAAVSVRRAEVVGTLERGLVVAEREWAARRPPMR